MKRRVWIAYTGGTIGMGRSERGWIPRPGWLEAEMARMPELHSEEMPSWELCEYEPLLDSSDMGPAEWLRIARDIADRHDDYDGFVVIHGTDTMAYTASALPFMLPGLAKPVVVTGSQIPLERVRSDGRSNLIAALQVAAFHGVPEVTLCFGSRLFRGCRATKIQADGLEAFHSPNFPALGRIGIDIAMRWELVRPLPPRGTALEAIPLTTARVGVLRLFPGISADLIRRVTAPPMEGLILETYGVGNAPTNQPGIRKALADATARGVIIVARTQCHIGRVDLGGYASGSDLLDAGVISGRDMTIEASLAKLSWLLGQDLDREGIARAMGENLRGELTPRRRAPDSADESGTEPPLDLTDPTGTPRADRHDSETWLDPA